MGAPESDTPRIRVAALIMIDDKILLVRHRKEGRDYHLLPGGGVEPGETIGGTLTREVAEETGLQCRISRPLFISDSIDPRGGRHVVNLVFLAERTGGEIRTPADERVVAAELHEPEALLGIDLRPPIGDHVLAAISSGFSDHARYLGPLWTH